MYHKMAGAPTPSPPPHRFSGPGANSVTLADTTEIAQYATNAFRTTLNEYVQFDFTDTPRIMKGVVLATPAFQRCVRENPHFEGRTYNDYFTAIHLPPSFFELPREDWNAAIDEEVAQTLSGFHTVPTKIYVTIGSEGFTEWKSDGFHVFFHWKCMIWPRRLRHSARLALRAKPEDVMVVDMTE